MLKTLLKLTFIMALVAIVVISFAPSQATQAAAVSFSGTFDGTEAEADLQWCGGNSPYDVIGPIQVTVTGDYSYTDISISYDVDMAIDIYHSSFDSTDTTINHVDNHDDGGTTTLTTGVNYFFVVQPFICNPDLGVWEFVLNGPGNIGGGGAEEVPPSFIGTFDGNEPEADLDYCREMSPYDVIGPVQVTISGNYTYTDVSINYDIDMAIDIYHTAFNPADTSANLVDGFDDGGSVNLVNGLDYFFVIMPLSCDVEPGTWEFYIQGDGIVGYGVNNRIAPDARINFDMGDTEIVLFPARDDNGNPTMQVYCVNVLAEGFLALVVNQADLLETAPAQNTLLASSDICSVELWALAQGSQYRYQLNAGPNGNGNVIELLFNSIGGADMEWRNFNLYDLD